MSVALARLILRFPFCMRMRENCAVGERRSGEWVTATEGTAARGVAEVPVSRSLARVTSTWSIAPKPSRAKKRNGRKTAFIKLSADVLPSGLLLPLSLSSHRCFSPRGNYGAAPPLPATSLPRDFSLFSLFVSFCSCNSWPPLPSWKRGRYV